MKKLVAISFMSFIFIITIQAQSFNFSIGTIGGSGLFAKNNSIGYLEGSLLDFYITNETFNLGLYISPFNYCVSNNEGALSILNATVFHQTFKLTDTSFIGPFFGIQWIDFNSNIPTIKSGIKISIRDDFSIGFYDKKVNYVEPILFNYLDIELGYINRNKTNQAYFSVKTDVSVFGALITSLLYSNAEENTKKYVPDYKERLPK
jgi:hypothetical protein